MEDVCGNLLGLGVSNISKFKSGDPKILQIPYKELVMSEFLKIFLQLKEFFK